MKGYDTASLELLYNEAVLHKKIALEYLANERSILLPELDVGYVYNNKQLNIYDSLVFPILNSKNIIEGLVVRTLTHKQYKIFNTLNTPLVYGLNIALNNIDKRVILTEGVIDKLSLDVLNLPIPSVSLLTANFSRILIYLFSLFFDTLYLAFDDDDAGRKATINFMEENSLCEVFVIEGIKEDLNNHLIEDYIDLKKTILRELYV